MGKTPYFNQETEDAILSYIAEENDITRDLLFNQFIYKPFTKLVEYHIYSAGTYKFLDSTDDFSHDVMRFLCEQLRKYKLEKGRAYSYFNVIARNYVWTETSKIYRKIKSSEELDVVDNERQVLNEKSYSEYQEEQRDFINIMLEYMDKHANVIFTNIKELMVIDSVLELFRIRENIEDFNKKHLYVLIRERTGLKTQFITKVINDFKHVYMIMFNIYKEHDYINVSPDKLVLQLKKYKNRIKLANLQSK